VELNDRPIAFSELIGLPVRDPNGRALGRIYEARGRWLQDGTISIDELLIGRRGVLKRLRGRGEGARGIPWTDVVEMDGDGVVVRV
jgi:sporulation protein YlmC with PRC-barrel domain